MPLLHVPGVYGPERDSELLASAVFEHVRPGDRVLDLFTGSGVCAIAAGLAGATEVHAVDVSRRAVFAARFNARLNGAGVRVHRGDLFEPIVGELFDLVVANPPYVPDLNHRGSSSGPARAWDAGPDGRRFLDPLIAGLPRHLRPGGRLLVVHSSLCGVERTLAALDGVGIDAGPVVSEIAPLGPITAPRAEALERAGLLAPGERTEATVVVAGTLRVAAADEAPVEAVAVA